MYSPFRDPALCRTPYFFAAFVLAVLLLFAAIALRLDSKTAMQTLIVHRTLPCGTETISENVRVVVRCK